ncbi:MAG: hypothetical protein WC870_03075 [Candidatus Paceibacterota bacterium]
MNTSLGVGLLIGGIIGIFIGATFGPSQKDYERAVGQCNVVRDDYVSSLERAISNVEEANNQIGDAQGYAWSSYNEMGEALDNLYEVNEVDDPQTTCY